MSRRKKRPAKRVLEDEAVPAPAAGIPARWPPSKPRRWMLLLAATCVLAWLAMLACMGLLYGN